MHTSRRLRSNRRHGDQANHQEKVTARRPLVVEGSRTVSLLFDARGVQSCMLKDAPYELPLGYTRTMMGFLLFQPYPRHISIIGLGGGSLAKYCYRYLPDTSIVAVEINAEVIALRERFCVPGDDDRFQVVCADGAHYVTLPGRHPDVLLVDGFHAAGLPSELRSTSFYQQCHRRLADDGVLVVNLMSDAPCFHRCVSSIRQVFGNAVALAPAEDSIDNVAVFAWKESIARPTLDAMLTRAESSARSHAGPSGNCGATRIRHAHRLECPRDRRGTA
jgi:spermidine synthase